MIIFMILVIFYLVIALLFYYKTYIFYNDFFEIEKQIRELSEKYNVDISVVRREYYWTGLRKCLCWPLIVYTYIFRRDKGKENE